MFKLSAAFVTALVLASGCDAVYFSAKVDAPEVCLSGLEVVFAPSAAGSTFEDTISAEDLGFLGSDKLELDAEVLAVGLTPTAGVSDFAFVDTLAVNMSAADESMNLPTLALVEMTARDRQGDGALYTEPAESINISTYMSGGDIVLSLEIAGDLPDTAWQANMDVCMHVSGTYTEPLE